jgi:O-antigen/teichoic acid export membrane protein
MAEQSALTLQILLVAFYINSCLTIAINACLMGMGHLKYFTFYSILRSLILLIFFLAFINQFGVIGAAFAYATSICVDIIYNINAIRTKLKFTPFHFWKSVYIPYFLVGLISGIVIHYVSAGWSNTWTMNACIISMYGLLSVSLIYLSKLVNKSEILTAWNYCIAIVGRK